jgi:hypothetical protein
MGPGKVHDPIEETTEICPHHVSGLDLRKQKYLSVTWNFRAVAIGSLCKSSELGLLPSLEPPGDIVRLNRYD